MKWLSNKWILGSAAFLLLLAIWLVFRETPLTVETGVVRRGEMLVTIDGEGKTRVREKYVVSAPVAGKLSRVRLKAGDFVPKNFVVAEIDPAPPERPPAPGETGNYTNFYAVKIYAPGSGRVLRVIEKDERMIAAGAPILEIGNPENLEIVVDVLSAEAARIRPGSEMSIENRDGDAAALRARVRTVEPQAFTKISALGVEEQRVNVVADLLEKSVSLGDNYRLDVRIVVWQAGNVLKAPSSALFRDGNAWRVFVVESGEARLRSVEIGRRNAVETEILSGLSEDDPVILHPANQIMDGSDVESK
jgi:multidrug efflux pump subunit AcrA (membrane-fusion protein)